jgi:hypothetical protein
MAILSNINGLFAVEDNGAIKFNNLTGTDNQVLIANTNSSPTWVDVSTIIGGPYLPLTGGTLAGAGNLVIGGTLAVNGDTTLNADLSATTATFTGNVGIGGTPGQNLDIQKSGARVRLIDGTNQLNMGLWDGANYRFEGDANRPIYMTSYQGNINFGISGGTTMTIQSGKVGIGTDSPDMPLDVAGNIRSRVAGNTAGGFYIGEGNTAEAFGLLSQGANGYFKIRDEYNNADRFYISNTGNVGIAATPGAYLSSIRALRIGQGASFSAFTNSLNTYVSSNVRVDATGTNKAIVTGESAQYRQSDGLHIWYNAASVSAGATSTLTERMRIDSSGNVGIGTTSPGTFYPGNHNLVVGDGNADSAITVYSNSANTGYLLFADGTSGSSSYTAQVRYNHSTNHMEFATNNSTSAKMTLDDNGNLGIGTTTLGVISGACSTMTFGSTHNALSGGVMFQANGTNVNGTYWESNNMRYQNIGDFSHTFYKNNTTVLFTIATTGTVTAVGDVVAYSDKKLKKNIKTLDGSKVYEMRGVSFDRIDTNKASSGVIAQEIQKVAPELIDKSKDGTLGVAYGNLTGYLIEAIKELEARVKELENK